jgi:hypothetical protein
VTFIFIPNCVNSSLASFFLFSFNVSQGLFKHALRDWVSYDLTLDGFRNRDLLRPELGQVERLLYGYRFLDIGFFTVILV